jgi:hypothetical protein
MYGRTAISMTRLGADKAMRMDMPAAASTRTILQITTLMVAQMMQATS